MLFFLLCLTSFFSPSALNDLAGPSAGPLARKTYSYSPFLRLPCLFPFLPLSSVSSSFSPSCLSSVLLSSFLHCRLRLSLCLFPRLFLLLLHLCFRCHLPSLLWLLLWFLWVLLLSLSLLSSLLSLHLLLLLLRRLLPLWWLWFLIPRPTFLPGQGCSSAFGGGGGGVTSCPEVVNVSGTQGASFSFAGTLAFRGGDQSYHSGTRGSHTVRKSVLSPSFFRRWSLFYRGSFLPPNPRTPLLFCLLGLTIFILNVVMTLWSFCPSFCHTGSEDMT